MQCSVVEELDKGVWGLGFRPDFVITSVFFHINIELISPSVLIQQCCYKELLEEYVLMRFKRSNAVKSEDSIFGGTGVGTDEEEAGQGCWDLSS